MNLTKRNKTGHSKVRTPATSLDAKQVLALAQLLQGERPSAVAKHVGVYRSTIWRWLRTPRFADALANLQDDLTTEGRGRVKSLSIEAVEVLAELLDCEDPRVRLAAANSILDRAGLDGTPGPENNGMAGLIVRLFGDGSREYERAKSLTAEALGIRPSP